MVFAGLPFTNDSRNRVAAAQPREGDFDVGIFLLEASGQHLLVGSARTAMDEDLPFPRRRTTTSSISPGRDRCSAASHIQECRRRQKPRFSVWPPRLKPETPRRWVQPFPPDCLLGKPMKARRGKQLFADPRLQRSRFSGRSARSRSMILALFGTREDEWPS